MQHLNSGIIGHCTSPHHCFFAIKVDPKSILEQTFCASKLMTLSYHQAIGCKCNHLRNKSHMEFAFYQTLTLYLQQRFRLALHPHCNAYGHTPKPTHVPTIHTNYTTHTFIVSLKLSSDTVVLLSGSNFLNTSIILILCSSKCLCSLLSGSGLGLGLDIATQPSMSYQQVGMYLLQLCYFLLNIRINSDILQVLKL